MPNNSIKVDKPGLCFWPF